jgi:hypothetical protein
VGDAYDGSTRDTLRIAPASMLMNALRYRCIVVGSCQPPAVSRIVSFTVRQRSHIDGFPPSLDICEGGTALAVAHVEGPSHTTLWQADTGHGFEVLHDGVEIAGATTDRMTLHPPASSWDGALLRCIVSDSCGADTSHAIVFRVHRIPQAVFAPSGSIAVCAGEHVQLHAGWHAGWTYRWLRDGVTLPQADSASLTVTVPGSYRLVVTDPSGCTDTSEALSLTVHPLPDGSIRGADSVACGTNTRYAALSLTGTECSWTVTGGVLLSAANADTVLIAWNDAGTGTLRLHLRDTATMCASVRIMLVRISPRDSTGSALHCSILAPDTVRNVAGRLSPQPSVIVCVVTNRSTSAVLLTDIALVLPATVVDSVAAATPLSRTPALLLQKGDSARFEWRIAWSGAGRARAVPLRVIARALNGDSTECTADVSIEALRTSLRCALRTSSDRASFHADSNKYVPETFTVDADLVNDGELGLQRLAADLSWAQSGGPSLLLLDPAQPDTTRQRNVARLLPGQGVSFSWTIRLRGVPIASDSVVATFFVSSVCDELPAPALVCTIPVVLVPERVLDMESTPPQPSGPALLRVHPNPVRGTMQLDIETSFAGAVQIRVVDMLGRTVAIPVDGFVPSGRRSIRFDASSLPAGVYACTLTTPRGSSSALFVVHGR